jgi:hypothetical protein
MNQKILSHYLQFSPFTDPGCYKKFLQKLPDDIETLGNLIRKQFIHRTNLYEGGKKVENFPWYRLRCEDDVLPNAISIINELLRLDPRGFLPDRKVENKVIITCRGVSVLMAAILKSKGVPCRVRSGFASYFIEGENYDHWLNEYWHEKEKRWVLFDADGTEGYINEKEINRYDIPSDKFYFAAQAWLGIREGKLKAEKFINIAGFNGLEPVLWAIFYDFHCLMNNEILYLQTPYYVAMKFKRLKNRDFLEIDELARLMLAPDKNFDQLVKIWNTKKKFRILNSPLIGDKDHVRWK